MSTNLPRVYQKIFGELADTTTPKRIAQFGSVVSGDPLLTGNIETIQALANWSNGWVGSTVTDRRYPTAEETTGVNKVLSQQLAYLLQKGIPEWDPDTTYYADNCYCQYGGKIWISRADNNTDNTPDDGSIYWEEFKAGGGEGGKGGEVGDIIFRLLPSTDVGKHLLDGTVFPKEGMYNEFYNYISDLYSNAELSANINMVGSLTNNNNVISGFNSNDYALLPVNFQPGSDSWEIFLKVTTDSLTSAVEQDIIAFQIGNTSAQRFGLRIYINASNYIEYSIGTSASAWVGVNTQYIAQPNTTYYLKYQFTGSEYILGISTDNETFTEIATTSSDVVQTFSVCHIGTYTDFDGVWRSFGGSIDLNECYIDVDDVRYWSGVTPSWAATEAEYQQAISTYGVCGKFVFDPTNETVRLPKVTGLIEGTIDSSALGTLVEAGLPSILHTHTGTAASSGAHTHSRGTMDITGTIQGRPNHDGTNTGGLYSASGAFSFGKNTGDKISSLTTGNMSTSKYNADKVTLKASNSWSGSTSENGAHTHTVTTNSNSSVNDIYGKSSTVQPQTIKGYLYIIVGTSATMDIPVDVSEIANDLAATQAQLANRANISLSNLGITASKNLDGQPIDSTITLASNVVYDNSHGNKVYSLANYLPSDNYVYAVTLRANVTTGATSGNFVGVTVKGDLSNTDHYITQAQTRAAAAITTRGEITLPIGVGRQITVTGSTSASANGTYTLAAIGYRRMGTNS